MLMSEHKEQFCIAYEQDEHMGGIFEMLLMARRYQGAEVEVFERGIHRKDVKHVDVKSMYPMIMIVLNLSPESLRLLRTKAYTGQYIITPTYIEIPDATIGKQLIIEVAEEDSISRRLLSEFYDRRQAYRNEKAPGWQGRQNTMKLIMNSIYGYNGMEWSRYGSYLVAIVVTAIGRFILKAALKWLKAQGCTPLEMDTDGIYVKGEFDPEELTRHIQGLFESFELREKLRLDAKDYEGMIVIRMKNYFLRSRGKNVFKGSGFHGRGVPLVCKHALDRIVDALFEDEPVMPVWVECEGTLFTASLRELEMTCNPSKPAGEYDEGNMYAKLLKQLPNFEWGGEVRYVRCVDEYVPLGARPDSELLEKIDYNYYHGRMMGVVERLLEPMVEEDLQLKAFYQAVWKRKKARKCTGCGKRLNKRVRRLSTDVCWKCVGWEGDYGSTILR